MAADTVADTTTEVQRLRRQVEVMLAHALDRGLTPSPQPWIFEAVRDRQVLLPHDEDAGWNVPLDSHGQSETTALVRAHRELSRLVAPARPASLVHLDELRRAHRTAGVPVRAAVRSVPRARVSSDGGGEPAIPGLAPSASTGSGASVSSSASSGASSRGPRLLLPAVRTSMPSATIPVMRRLIVAVVIFLLVFVLLASIPAAREATLGKVAEAGVDGRSRTFGGLLLRELFLLAGAGLGASFTALYAVTRDVARATYDPELDLGVLGRVLVGMTCGLVVAELLPIGDGGVSGDLASLAVPAVALVAGFSASVVLRILTRMVTAVETLFSGDPDEVEEMRRELEQKRIEEMLAQAERVTLARLLEIRRLAASGAPSRSVVDEIDRMVTDVVPV